MDIKVKMLISGEELEELQKLTWAMADAFDLDLRIEEYDGTSPISFYRWDMECLLDVIDSVLDDSEEYPDHNSSGYRALKNLFDRLKSKYERYFEKWVQ